MDWNIFFSAASQTCGAIIGIFSAFLITKIIADQAEFLKLKDKISDMISSSDYLKAKFEHVYFEDLNTYELECLRNKLYSDIKNTELNKNPESYYLKEDQPLFASKSEVLKHIRIAIDKAKRHQRSSQAKIAEQEREAEKIRKIESKLGKNGSVLFKGIENFCNNANLPKTASERIIGHPALTAPQETRRQIECSAARQNNREEIDKLMTDVLHQLKLNNKFAIEIKGVGRSHKLINLSLLAVVTLFYAGIIYPLSFLPLPLNAEINLSFMAFFDILWSLKGGMLSLLSMAFTGLLGFFWHFNRNIKIEKKQADELSIFTKPEGFSEYCKNYYDNKARIKNGSLQTPQS